MSFECKHLFRFFTANFTNFKNIFKLSSLSFKENTDPEYLLIMNDIKGFLITNLLQMTTA